MKQLYTTVIILILSIQVVFSQTCKDSITISTPDSQFTVSRQEVTDSQTDLIWQKCSLGQSGSDCRGGNDQRYTWSEALHAAETERQQTGKAWRLPNVKELLSITEDQCFSPAINLTIFPNTNSSGYWSATAGYSDSAWGVSFEYGSSGNELKSEGLYVRLVRTK